VLQMLAPRPEAVSVLGAFLRFESKQPLWKRAFVPAEIIGGQSTYANGLIPKLSKRDSDGEIPESACV
jgi:hypothetical protein